MSENQVKFAGMGNTMMNSRRDRILNKLSLMTHYFPVTPSLQFVRSRSFTIALVFSLAFAMGCNRYINKPFQPVNLQSYEAVRYWPPTGIEFTAQIGEPMMRTIVVPILPAMKLQDSIVHITNYRDNLRMKLEADRGILELVGTDGERGRYFATLRGLRLSYEAKDGFTDLEVLRGGIHVSATGMKSMYWFWSEEYKNASMVPAPPIQYSVFTTERSPNEARFRRELVYSGTAQSTLLVLYREFKDDSARPAFSQNLKYDFSKGNIIGYKDARFDVLNVGNTSITLLHLSLRLSDT